MTDCLNIRIMNLERAMVGTCFFAVLGEEKGMMIYPFFLSVDVHEGCYFYAVWCGQQVGSFEIEVLGVEVVCLFKTRNKPRRGFL